MPSATWLMTSRFFAAHARLAREASGDDADVGASDVGVGVRARELGVVARERGELVEVEGLALGRAAEDVEEDDVAEILLGGEEGEGAADLTGANHCNLLRGHDSSESVLGERGGT
jgi:hypothetical protein